MTKEDAARLEKVRADRVQRAALPSDGNRKAPPVGGDGSQGAAGNVGGYNNFWIDNGTEYFSIHGQKRVSIIVDPPDGRMPGMTPAGKPRTARVPRPTPGGPAGAPRLQAPRGAGGIRGSRAPSPRRALPARIRIDVRSPRAAGALQQLPRDRADAVDDRDPQRDGARRAHRPHERGAPAAGDPEVDGRFSGPVGGRYARRRHHELHRQDTLPRREREPARRRGLLADRCKKP